MRLHRWLLTLYPKSFRHEYGGEIQRVFRRRLRDAAGPLAAAGVWAAEIGDAAANAARVHADILRQDLRCSWRSLRRAPAFFAAAVLVVGLGIGATTAAFTLTDHVLLRPLPFPDADRLVKIWQADPSRPIGQHGLQGTNDVSPANYRDWKQQSSSFDELGAYAFVSSNVVGGGDPERVAGATVTPAALRAVGVPPAVGRALDETDDRPGAQCVVLVSHAFNLRRFDGAALGQHVVLDDEQCSVVGIMPPRFEFPVRDTAFWRPIRFEDDAYEDRNNTYLRVIARLKTGVGPGQAAADLSRVSVRLAELYPNDNKEVGAAVMSIRDEVNDQSRLMIYAVAGASACLLLIACTNLASLFLARAAARARELAERLMRQLLTDAIIVCVAGGALGVVIATVAVPLAATLVPTTLPVSDIPSADWRMLIIAASTTLLTVLVCGVAPAVRAVRRASAVSLRDGARVGTSRRTERLRGVLVTAQVAASVALLVCTGLLLRALWRVQAIDPGFRTESVLTMKVNLPWPQYESNAARVRFYDRVVEDVRGLPGVESAGFASFLPLTMRGGIWGIYLPGRPATPGHEAQMALIRFVTHGYFDALGIPVAEGRSFDARDTVKGAQVAIVSRTFGDALWPGQSPIGQRFVMMRTERTIIGIVPEIKVRGIERRNEPQVYVPGSQQPDRSFITYTPRDLAVRTSLDVSAAGELAASIRGIVARADPRLPVSDVRPLAAIVEGDLSARTAQAHALRAFAGVAVLLAAVGLHGLLAFMVSSRTREIGVRMALGATRRAIVIMIVARGVRLACIGGAIGLGAGYLAGASYRSVLAGIEPADLAANAGAMAVALGMTLAGSFWPAVRAARTEPMVATRVE